MAARAAGSPEAHPEMSMTGTERVAEEEVGVVLTTTDGRARPRPRQQIVNLVHRPFTASGPWSRLARTEGYARA
jgi:hypothetical protein